MCAFCMMVICCPDASGLFSRRFCSGLCWAKLIPIGIIRLRVTLGRRLLPVENRLLADGGYSASYLFEAQL